MAEKTKKKRQPPPFIKQVDVPAGESYVRSKINAKNKMDILNFVAKANGIHDGDWHKIVGKKDLIWPLDPIEVARNIKQKLPSVKKGQTVTQTKKEMKERKKFFPFTLIDGVHRFSAARTLKMTELPYRVISEDDPAERFIRAYKSSSHHGLRLDKDERDRAVRLMGLPKEKNGYGIPEKRLVELTGMAQSSINRIIHSKQRSMEPRKKPDKEAGTFTEASQPITANTTNPVTAYAEMTPQGFLERLQILANEWKRLAPGITEFLATLPESKRSVQLPHFIDTLKAVTSALTLALPVKADH